MALHPVNRSIVSAAQALFGFGAKSTALAFMADGLLPYMPTVMGVEIPRADFDLFMTVLGKDN
jgi:hypothetical protein